MKLVFGRALTHRQGRNFGLRVDRKSFAVEDDFEVFETRLEIFGLPSARRKQIQSDHRHGGQQKGAQQRFAQAWVPDKRYVLISEERRATDHRHGG